MEDIEKIRKFDKENAISSLSKIYGRLAKDGRDKEALEIHEMIKRLKELRLK